MKVLATEIPGVLIIEPRVFGDERGFFFESFNLRRWREQTGLATEWHVPQAIRPALFYEDLRAHHALRREVGARGRAPPADQ